VYLEGYQKLQTWGPGTGGNETVARGGGANMAEGMHSQYGEITPEWVVTARPEAIIKVSPSKERYVADTPEDLRQSAQEIAQRPGWEVLEAVKSGRIYVLGSEIQGGPRAPIGAAYVAKWLHPQACRDIDPEAWHREYLERFQKMPYRGSFAWPPAGQAQ
jgi:iron complex transport system substrate-binding protein